MESKIMKAKLVKIITGWIERNGEEFPLNKKGYKFELPYRSSRDHNVFRDECNNPGSCLILVKQQSSTKITEDLIHLDLHTNELWYK